MTIATNITAINLERRARSTMTPIALRKGVIVLCLNDHPIGVYTTPELADEAAEADWKGREPTWKEHGLTSVGSAFQKSLGIYMRYHYHQHEFEVDAPARL